MRSKADKEGRTHPRGWTVLHLAASRNRVGVLRILLKANANKNAPDKDFRTPLYAAVTEGHTKSALILLQHGGEILRLSATKGSRESIQDVLQRGTNGNSKDEQGRTALSIAALRGDPHIVQELLEAGSYLAEIQNSEIKAAQF